jgi:hypothetical protein
LTCFNDIRIGIVMEIFSKAWILFKDWDLENGTRFLDHGTLHMQWLTGPGNRMFDNYVAGHKDHFRLLGDINFF